METLIKQTESLLKKWDESHVGISHQALSAAIKILAARVEQLEKRPVIKTIGDLIVALEKLPRDAEVRSSTDYDSQYYYPYIKVEEEKSRSGKPVIVLSCEVIDDLGDPTFRSYIDNGHSYYPYNDQPNLQRCRLDDDHFRKASKLTNDPSQD